MTGFPCGLRRPKSHYNVKIYRFAGKILLRDWRDGGARVLFVLRTRVAVLAPRPIGPHAGHGLRPVSVYAQHEGSELRGVRGLLQRLAVETGNRPTDERVST